MIHECLRSGNRQDDDNLHHNPGRLGKVVRRIAEPRANRLKSELKRADVNGGQGRHEPRQIEPRGRPAPAAVTQDGGPVVEPARRRKRGGDLPHRRREGESQQTGGRPTEPNRRPAHAAQVPDGTR